VDVARDPAMALSPLRDLLREDADWNLLLSDITERATDAVEQLGKFEQSFSGQPDHVPVSLLEPKMSAIAHRSPAGRWHPENVLGLAIQGTELHVTLVHCKYSSEPTAGARVTDLYELCGQAMRGAKWRQQGAIPLLQSQS